MHSSFEKYFPKLIRIGNTSEQDEFGTSYLYTLDWSEVDKQKSEKFFEWFKNYRSDFEKPKHAPKTLPDNFEKWIKNIAFRIPENYLREIEHFSCLFQTERVRRRLFDTVIREKCLEVAEQAADCAFMMLVDCAISMQGEHIRRKVLKSALLFKFWAHKTGNGLIKEISGVDDLKELISEDNFVFLPKLSKYEKKLIVNFTKEIDELIDNWNNVYRNRLIVERLEVD